MKNESGFYLTDKNELLVVFGGRIQVSSYVVEYPDGSDVKELNFREAPEYHEIGEKLGEATKEEYNDFHPIRFEFHDNRSIDVVINHLQQMKSFIKEK